MTRSRWWPASASLVTGLALTLAGPATTAWGAEASAPVDLAGASQGPLVTMKLQSAALIDALRSLTQDAEIVIANEAGLKDKTVSINLKDKPVEEALNKLLSPNDIPWYRSADGTYIINATKPGPAPTESFSPSGFLAPAPELSPLRKYLVTEKIELRHISPDDAMEALGLPRTGVYDRRSAAAALTNSYPMGDYRDPSTVPGATIEPGQTGARPINPTVMLNPSVNETAVPITNGIGDGDGFNRSPEERDQFGQAGRRPGFTPNPNVQRPPGAPGAPGGVAGAPGTGTGTGTQNSARGFLPPGIELVAGLATDNSLMVLGPPDDIDELRSTIRLLDVVPQQVSIKVDVITVSVNALRQFGTTFQFFSRDATVGANAGPVPGGLTFDIIRGNVQAVIGALTTNGRGRNIASPIVTTQNNTPAQISQFQTVPVFVPQVLQSQGGIVTNTQVYPVQAQTGLIVIPRVNRDGTITVQGTVNVSSITRIVSSPDGSTIAPEISGTNYSGFVRTVASGETLVIGGLNTKAETDEENRVPLLSDIPLIGKLFRGRQRNNRDSQLLIFLTPKLVGSRANEGDTPP